MSELWEFAVIIRFKLDYHVFTADSGGKVIRLKHWNKIKPWEFVLVQIGTIRSRNTKTRKNLEERAANWEQAERFDRIQLCFPLLYVSLGWVIHSVFCSSFRNTDNMFWFMDSFFAYFNYLLINLSALVAADTHTMLQDARKHQRIIIISFPKKSWVKGRTACSLSCPLLSFSLCSSSTETSEKEKDKCALPPDAESVCVCVCHVSGQFLSRSDFFFETKFFANANWFILLPNFLYHDWISPSGPPSTLLCPSPITAVIDWLSCTEGEAQVKSGGGRRIINILQTDLLGEMSRAAPQRKTKRVDSGLTCKSLLHSNERQILWGRERKLYLTIWIKGSQSCNSLTGVH